MFDVSSGSIRLSEDGLRELSMGYSEAGEGPAVLLLHGNLAGRKWWREVLENPIPGFRFIAPDLPGFGESRADDEFRSSISFYARAASRLLDELDVDRVVPVGHSMGGAVVMEMAAHEPERFCGMALLGSAPPDGLRMLPHLHPFLQTLRDDESAMREMLLHAMPTRTPPYMDELVAEARMMHASSFVGNAQVLGRWDRKEEMSRYEKPALVASGEWDRLIRPRDVEATMKTFPRSQRVAVPKTGHSPQIERPGIFLRTLENFLRDIEYQRPRGLAS